MTYKTDAEILKNAPDSATHYCCGTYCKANKDFFYDWDGEYWCAYFVPDGDMRSLADIEALVERDKKIAELEGYEKLFKEGKINHHRNLHKKVVKIKGEILGAQSAYDHALMAGLGNMSVSTGLIIDLVDYAQQSDNRIAELEKELELHGAIDSKARNRIYEKGAKMQVKRDLEQQAKGAEDIIESVLGEPESLTSDALSIRYEFLDRAKQLREQAKGGDV